MSDESAIRVRGLRKTYGSFVAVEGLDLDVARGECFALLGPNGAGKTTTVEILEGYRPRSAGEVSVLGLDPAHPTRDWRARGRDGGPANAEVAALARRQRGPPFAPPSPPPRDPGRVTAAAGPPAPQT